MANFSLKTIFSRAVTNQIAEKFSKIKDKLLPKSDAEKIGDQIVSEMKALITKGVSPIKGTGRFPAYKNPKNYPGRIRKQYPQKKNTPVNLTLSGDFLKSLKSSVRKDGILIGLTTRLSKEKESDHRTGKNTQPKRPIIPLVANGEQFALKIQTVYINGIKKNIKKI